MIALPTGQFWVLFVMLLVVGMLFGIGIGVAITENSSVEQPKAAEEVVKEVVVTATVVPTATLTEIPAPTSTSIPTEPVATPTSTLTPTLTPTLQVSEERIWTTQELVQCDNSTLARQLSGEDSPSKEKLSDCEVALVEAYLEASRVVEEEFSDRERRVYQQHEANFKRVNQVWDGVASDGVLTEAEAEFLCTVVGQQAEQIQVGLDFVQEMAVMGLEVDFIRQYLRLKMAEAACLPGGAGIKLGQ